MTKRELIKALAQFEDDEVVHVVNETYEERTFSIASSAGICELYESDRYEYGSPRPIKVLVIR